MANVIGMLRYGQPTPGLRRVLQHILDRRHGLAVELAQRITDDVDFYATDAPLGKDPLTTILEEQIAAMLERFLAGDEFDLTVSRRTGEQRAAAGVPVTAVMDAYRIGANFIWRTVVDEALVAGVPAEELLAVTAELWQAQADFTNAMADSYRDESTALLLTQQAERAALVEALMSGKVLTRPTVWEIADLLKLPFEGPFHVVAAVSPELGRTALPAVERRLAAVGVRSAWRLLPELQVGIVCVSHSRSWRALRVELGRYPATRQGVSPAFDRLDATGVALHLARIALDGAPLGGGLTVFDESPLAVTSVAAPEVMARVAGAVLGSLRTMRAEDREILLHTFSVWVQSGGSADTAARALFCHPNTVRQRLRRLEERTGRSLADPLHLTEITLAAETERHLPLWTSNGPPGETAS